MLRSASSATVALVLIAACTEPVAAPTPFADDARLARAARESDPTATWKIPIADAALAFRSDGQFSDGTHSVYANGVCGVSAKIFATTAASNSGDATIQTSAPKGTKCGRLFQLSYPDGQTETVWSFNNVPKIQNTTSSIPVGSTVHRRLLINPGVVSSPSRCGRLIFGPNGSIGSGSDSVRVTRVDARTWQVQSQPAPFNRAHCELTGEVFAMPVSFVIVASRDLP